MLPPPWPGTCESAFPAFWSLGWEGSVRFRQNAMHTDIMLIAAHHQTSKSCAFISKSFQGIPRTSILSPMFIFQPGFRGRKKQICPRQAQRHSEAKQLLRATQTVTVGTGPHPVLLTAVCTPTSALPTGPHLHFFEKVSEAPTWARNLRGRGKQKNSTLKENNIRMQCML